MRGRVLFVCEAVTLAHVARPLVFAKAARQVFDVQIAAAPSVHHLLRRECWQPFHITSLSQFEFMNRLRWGRSVFTNSELYKNVEEDLKLIRDAQPSVVVGDFRLSLSISCRVCKVPYIALGNAYWLPNQFYRLPVPEMLMTHVCGVGCSQWVFDRVAPRIMAAHARAYNAVRQSHGVAPIQNDLGLVYLDADITALVDLPECYPKVMESDQLKFIGPCVWSPPVESIVKLTDNGSSNKKVFVSLGSSGQIQVLETVISGLLDCEYKILLATAGRSVPEKFRLNNNIVIADFLPGMEATLSADFVVCNGGSPMCQLAMMCGKPVIGIPSNLDQFLNMDMVNKNGLGIMLRPEGIDVDAVIAAVKLIENERVFVSRPVEYAKASNAYVQKRKLNDLIKSLMI